MTVAKRETLLAVIKLRVQPIKPPPFPKKQESFSYRKDDCAMHPIYAYDMGALKIFKSP